MTKSEGLGGKGSLEPMGSPHGAPGTQPAHGLIISPHCFTPFAPNCKHLLLAMSKTIPMTSVFPKPQLSLSYSEKSCGQQNYLSRRQVHSAHLLFH